MNDIYKHYLVQVPDCFRADQKLKHVVKGVGQMPLKQGVDHFLRKPVPVLDHPLCKEMFQPQEEEAPSYQSV